MNGECIFCKIVNREIPSQIVYEDPDCVSVVDINPRSKGMCIVIPKKHYTNFDDDLEISSKIFDKALIVGEKIKKALNPLTVFFSVMPAQVPHFHIRVYPVYKDQVPLFENKPIDIEEEELETLTNRIRSAIVDWKGRETVKIVEKPKEEKKEEPKSKRSEEDVFWMKRSMKIP